MNEPHDSPIASNFIRDLVVADVEQGTFGGRVQTRFPPEPNGYLHIGHAKAISLDFGIAAEFGGTCNLRFDDTNPDTEETTYVDGIIEDLGWLGFPIDGEVLYASDYFETLYGWAEVLIGKNLAYVDDQTGETISEQRGGYGRPGSRARSATGRSRRTSIGSGACGPVSSARAPVCCGPGSTCSTTTCRCATR